MTDFKIAVAVDDRTVRELRKDGTIKGLLQKCPTKQAVSTIDCKYHIFLWDYDDLDPVDERYLALKKALENVRHSIIEIGEDGNIWTDIEIEDANGCDEEFETILGWKAEICLWSDVDNVLL